MPLADQVRLVSRPPEMLGQQRVAGVQAIGVIPANTGPLETQPVGVIAREKSCSVNAGQLFYSSQNIRTWRVNT